MLRKKNFDIWESISDLMAGLMMLFLFVGLAFLYQLDKQKNDYLDTKKQIYVDLSNEFSEDELHKWGAEINEKTLAIYFKEPDVMFLSDRSDVRKEFQTILADFFPRYIETLHQEKYQGKISEIRIEGYASRKWRGDPNSDTAYFHNMQLSQERARNVLRYLFWLPYVQQNKDWLKPLITTNGFSSTRAEGNDAYDQRVEFRVMTNAEQELMKIVGEKKE